MKKDYQEHELTAFLLDELDDERRAEIAQILKESENARAELEQLQAATEDLDQALAVEPVVGLGADQRERSRPSSTIFAMCMSRLHTARARLPEDVGLGTAGGCRRLLPGPFRRALEHDQSLQHGLADRAGCKATAEPDGSSRNRRSEHWLNRRSRNSAAETRAARNGQDATKSPHGQALPKTVRRPQSADDRSRLSRAR